jgi:hypothetical protein
MSNKTLNPAYVAGIIDGEGWIGFHTRENGTLRVAIRVKMTNMDVPMALHAQYGGSIQHYKQARERNRKAQHEWIIIQDQACLVLIDIFQYLIVKRKQAILALSYLAAKPGVDAIELCRKIKADMHDLNRRGVQEAKLSLG